MNPLETRTIMIKIQILNNQIQKKQNLAYADNHLCI